MPTQNQPNKQRQQMDRYLESQGLLNYQTKGMSQAQIAAKYKAAGVGVNQNWFAQNYKGAQQGQQQGPNFEPPKARGQAVPFNANPNGFTTMPNFGTPQNPTPPIAYEFVQNGLAVKVKLPQPVRTPGTGATNAQALRGETNWTDIFVDERKSILKDPTFYKDNKITQYPMWMQSQIIADPSFDWTQVPKWQRPYFELSSRPAAMGAVQGGIMALGASGPVGAVAAAGAGAVLGAFAGWSGYDQNKEAWQQGDNKWTWNAQQIKDAGKGAFGYLNLLAEFAEKSIGTTAQVISAASDPNKKVVDYLNKDTFNSSASFFEAITPALQAAAQTGKGRLEWTDAVRVLTPALFEGGAIIDLLRNPEKYKGEERYLGAALPVELSQSWTERLDAARAEIASGRNYREVATEFQTGIMAQIGDMAGQGIADPLNAFGRVTSGAGKVISEATGNKIAAEAFTNTDGLREASLKYKTLVQTGEAAKIDPTFDAAKLNTFERWAAGVNKEGQVKAGGILSGGRGLLDPAPTSNKAADFVRMLGTETPQSRAETGATMFSRNVGQIISMFTTPEEAVGYIKRIAGGDNTAWRDMGSAIGNSPEWYTIQPALKNFVTTKLEGIQKAWETGAVNRDALNRIADVLGEKPGQLLDDWAARGTHEQDFARIIERAKQAGTPEAKALLADVDAKNFTAATLQQIVDIFHGEGSLPYDPAQWKYMMYSELTDHFQTWAADKLALDKSPEAKSAFFRTVGVLKAAQSILLLGANPGYAIQNGLSGMVHLAATGIYGSMTPKQMGDWITRWETPIPRVDEGVGMGGIVDVKKSSAISDAGKGTGPLTDVKQTLGKISRGMPMSKLSSWFESRNSTRGYVTAMRQFWGNSWRRGVGFREMPKELTGVIRQMGIDPNTIYAAIEAGVNQKEIEAALFGQYQGVKAQSLIHDAAKAAGVTAADAADMLNKIGITDTLDTFLAKADTPEKVTAAFGRAEQQVQDWLDMRTAEELKGRAEDVKNRVGMEGAAAGLDVAHRANNEFINAWLDHYARFGDLFEGLDAIDPAMRNKAFEEAYRQSDENFRRVYARHGANYQGIFDVWGLSGDADATRVLQSISETNVAMKAAYDFMRAERRGLFENLDEGQITPTAEQWATSTKRIDAAFKKAFDTKHNAEVKQGQALAAIYEKFHGPAAGEAARLWWDDVTKFSEQIVKDEQAFRKSIDQARAMGADRDQIAAAKRKYYSEKKIGMIANLERLNQEGIARLERVIKNGGSADPTATPAPTSPTPTDPNAPTSKAPTAKQKREAEAAEVRAMERAAEERRIAEQQARRQAEASVWDIAEKYWGNGGNYSRTTLQDRFSLIGALKKPEYGGDPTLTGLTDPRITADFVTQVMEARTLAKQAEAEAKSPTLTKRADKVAGKIVRVGDNTNILRAIQQIGGLRMDLAKDLTGEKKPRTMPGVFQVKGINIDMMAMRLAEYGYPIDLNNPDDIGGMGQTAELLRRAISGDRILPMHANLEAEIEARAANEAIRQQAIIDAEPPFDADAWHASMKEASKAADLNRIAELMGEVPEDMNAAAHDADGETYSEYTSRMWDDVAYRIEQETQAETIAQAKTEADLATADAERRADAVTTRVLLKEQFAGIFGEEQAQTYMELSDTIAQWYERTTGESADEFYSRYYEDVKRSAEADIAGGLQQKVFHGSPYKFDKFTLDKIGTGEGAQAYGWGLYFAGDRSIAEWYRETLAYRKSDASTYKGAPLSTLPDPVRRAVLDIERNAKTRADAERSVQYKVEAINQRIASAERIQRNPTVEQRGDQYYAHPVVGFGKFFDSQKEARTWAVGEWQNEINQLTTERGQIEAISLDDFSFVEKNEGQLYAVDIPDDNYLLWDKPLSEQPQSVRDAAVNALVKNGVQEVRDTNGWTAIEVDYSKGDYKVYDPNGDLYTTIAASNPQDAIDSVYIKNAVDMLSMGGSEFYKTLKEISGDDKAASLALKEAGINGIQYLDGSSRGKGDGNYNYVIFDDSAVNILETFYQAEGQGNVKGAVVFNADGIRATIHAFESADFSTLVHENAHVFRRVLKDVAERTGNKQTIKDLATIEEWAGVKDGNWTVGAEEKFARGFEKYIATGEAPTPRLKKAFETFGKWMTSIYRTITGSAIDVKISDEVKGVFDRMLGAEFTDSSRKTGGRVEALPNGGAIINFADGGRNTLTPIEVLGMGGVEALQKLVDTAQKKVAESKGVNPLYQRNKAQVSSAQFDMFAPKPEQADMFAPQADAGTTGGLLPGMQEATGMMFDVQPGSGQLTRMEAPTARSIYEIDPARTATDSAGNALSKGDIVEDADGKRHNVSGANMRGKIVTEAGRILEPKEVKRVARQDSLFQKAEPIDTPAFKNWFGNSKVVDENGRPLVVYHGSPKSFSEFKSGIRGARGWNEDTYGFFFSPIEQVGKNYAGKNGEVKSVYLSLNNPKMAGSYSEIATLNKRKIDQAISEGYDGYIFKPSKEELQSGYYGPYNEEYVAFYPEQIKSTSNRGTFDPNNPNILFQQADQPFGTYEDASQFPPHSAAMDEGYSQHVRPLLDAMKQLASQQVQSKPLDGATLDMSPEGQAALRKYMKQVQADMAGTKNAATKWGESQRDFAMLNYNKRYGIDRYMETVYPYQFFYTRSLMTWAARALDKPAIFSNYARMKKQMDRYERDIPERLRNKIKINAPWMPDWMGDALYIDPISSLFTPLNYLKPFERKLQDTNYQNIEAERILQEWAADGMASQSDIVQAVKTREGKTWERAFAEAQIRRESDLNNPMDFLNTMLGPAWYLTTPYKLLTGKGAQVGSTPILNTTRAIDTVTQGTWAEPVGDVLGMIGKPEEMLRQKLNMPEFGEYGDYYIDRQLSNMVADGLISSDEAQVAMIERRGADFETARERVKMELAMRVPTASALLAGLTAENFGQGVARAAMTAPASLFGAGLLPAGELEYRNLKQEWNEAWKMKDQGNDQAITNFFDEHPEYEAYLAKGKKPEERLRSFLVSQIWDGYMSLGATDKKQFAAEVGDVFKQSFLDSETRSIETLNVDQLAQWAQMLDRKVPDVPATQPTLTNPAPAINYFAPEITRVTDKYFTDRAKLFPNYYAYQQQYYMIPYTDKSKRLAYLTKNPEYAEYLKWQEGYYNKYPELKPVFNGQVFKRVDVSGWPPALADYVSAYAYTGSRLPNGAFKALQQEWISQGKPMGDMQTWLDSQVVPFMLYGQ